MRIIHVMECFAGGTFEFLSELIQEMPEHEYIIIHGKRENTPLNYKDRFPQHTTFIPWKNAQREISLWKDMKALMELVKILKKYSTEKTAIHLHSSKAGFLGRLAAQLLGKSRNVLYTAHGAAFLRKDVSKSKHLLYIWLEKIAGYFGGTIVACSNSEGEEFRKNKIKNVIVISNGIKIEKIEEASKKDEERIVIGTLARITHQKNPKQFNEIAKRFTENKKMKFLWIGDGELREELKSSNIEITGWLSKEEAKKRLKEIDIYLSTSLWEGLPLSVLEAMSIKKPLILSDCIGNRDLISNNGFLFIKSEETIPLIQKMIEDRNLRIEYGKNSLENLKNRFYLRAMLVSYQSLYRDISMSM